MEKEKIKEVRLYQTGEFVDLCRGSHIKNTKEAPLSFKLVMQAVLLRQGTNPMLDRVEGLAFNRKGIRAISLSTTEAEKRDHRLWGRS